MTARELGNPLGIVSHTTTSASSPTNKRLRRFTYAPYGNNSGSVTRPTNGGYLLHFSDSDIKVVFTGSSSVVSTTFDRAAGTFSNPNNLTGTSQSIPDGVFDIRLSATRLAHCNSALVATTSGFASTPTYSYIVPLTGTTTLDSYVYTFNFDSCRVREMPDGRLVVIAQTGATRLLAFMLAADGTLLYSKSFSHATSASSIFDVFVSNSGDIFVVWARSSSGGDVQVAVMVISAAMDFGTTLGKSLTVTSGSYTCTYETAHFDHERDEVHVLGKMGAVPCSAIFSYDRKAMTLTVKGGYVDPGRLGTPVWGYFQGLIGIAPSSSDGLNRHIKNRLGMPVVHQWPKASPESYTYKAALAAQGRDEFSGIAFAQIVSDGTAQYERNPPLPTALSIEPFICDMGSTTFFYPTISGGDGILMPVGDNLFIAAAGQGTNTTSLIFKAFKRTEVVA